MAWLSGAVAITWGALVVVLSRPVWPMLGNSAGTMWVAWISSPDFSWSALGRAGVGHLGGLVSLVLMLVASFGAGCFPARFLAVGSGPARTFLQMAMGWGLISFLQQGLGYSGLHFRLLFGLEAGLLVLLGASALWKDQPWRGMKGKDWSPEWPRLLALALMLACAFLLSRLPDTAEDARLYHLAGPESYLLVHKIFAMPQHFAWHMPFGAEMDFTIPFALGGVVAAKLVNVAVLIVLLGLAWRLSVSLGKGSLWSAVWVGTAGLVFGQCWEGKNDLVLAMYCTGAALCGVEAVKGDRRWLVPLAWLAGLAIGVKFTAGLFLAGLVGGLFILLSPRLSLRRWVILAAVLLVPCAGWLGESWLFLGDPFHPFLSGIFPDLDWGPFYSTWLNRQARAISPAEALMRRDWLLGLWRGIGSYDHGSVALFGLLPLALIGRKSRGARLLVVCASVMYLAWLPSHRNARYLFPIIPLVAALASDGMGGAGIFSGWGHRWRNAVGAYSLVLALLCAAWPLAPSGYLCLLGQYSAGNLLHERFSSWEDMRLWANGSVPWSGKLLLSGEERRLWFSCRTVSNGPVFEPPFWKWTRESRTPADVRRKVRQAGFTHLVHNFVSGQYRRLRWYPGPEWDDRQLELFRAFASGYMAHAWRSPHMDNNNGGFQAFVFSPVPLARPSRVFFLPSAEGIFWDTRHAYEAGRKDEALAGSSRILARVPGVREFEYLVAAMVYGMGDNRQAWGFLEPGIREGFISSFNIAYGARALLGLGRTTEAVKLFALEARMTPGPVSNGALATALLMRAEAAMMRRDYRRAWHDAEAGGNLLTGDARFGWIVARALSAMGRFKEAARFPAGGRLPEGGGPPAAAAGIGPGAPPRSMMGK